jgi:hypothetical protein
MKYDSSNYMYDPALGDPGPGLVPIDPKFESQYADAKARLAQAKTKLQAALAANPPPGGNGNDNGTCAGPSDPCAEGAEILGALMSPLGDQIAAAFKDLPVANGFHRNHINQSAAFPDIPRADGLAIYMNPWPHLKLFHGYLNDFWKQFKENGPKFGQRPTNADYDAAMRGALEAAGCIDKGMVDAIVDAASAERDFYGLVATDPLKRIPGLGK